MLLHLGDCNLMLKKAVFLSYHVREVGLPFVDSCKDLGLLVDTELNFMGTLDLFFGNVLECR